jgi:hypothetical protein
MYNPKCLDMLLMCSTREGKEYNMVKHFNNIGTAAAVAMKDIESGSIEPNEGFEIIESMREADFISKILFN